MKKLAILLLFGILTNTLISQEYLAAVAKEEKWGYIDMEGNWVIEPQFSSANYFHNGYARVEIGYDHHYVNLKGESQTAGKKYKVMRDFSNGYARVKYKGKWGFIDTSFDMVIAADYEEAKDFSEGLFPVESKKGWGYIDINNKWVIEPQYEKAYSFHGGNAMVRINGYWYFINKAGELQTNKKDYRIFKEFHEGLTKIVVDKEWGYIDEQFKVVIQPNFYRAKDFSEGVAPVEFNEEWGYIDKNGNWLDTPKYDKAYEFHDGLAMVKIKSTWYYIDKNFQIMEWSRQMEPTHSYKYGMARIKLDGNWGFLDTKGELVIKPNYSNAKDFSRVID